MITTPKTVRVEAIFRALSDRTRLRIVNMLLGGERCVCDLVDFLGVPQPTASRHLAYLRRVGLVLVRKEGPWCYYRLVPARGPFFAKLMACLAVCCRELPQLVQDKQQLQDHGASCCE